MNSPPSSPLSPTSPDAVAEERIFDLTEVPTAGADALLGLKYTFASNKKVVAEMLVDARHTQPMGLLHGGISCVLAESVGSVASNLANQNEPDGTAMVGLSLVANHLKSGMVGDVIVATALPLHLGRSSHLWNVEITSKEYGYTICSARLTTHVMRLDARKHKAPFIQPGLTDPVFAVGNPELHATLETSTTDPQLPKQIQKAYPQTSPNAHGSKPVHRENAARHHVVPPVVSNTSSQHHLSPDPPQACSRVGAIPLRIPLIMPQVAPPSDGSYPFPACL